MKKKLLVLFLSLTMVLSLVLSACVDTGNDPDPDPDPTPISLSETTVMLKVGGTKDLNVNDLPDGASVTWTSSNTAVVTVANGKITAVAFGTASVSAKVGDETLSCSVTVLDMQSELSLVVGDESTLTVNGLPSGTTVTWASATTATATVAAGKVTAVAEGTSKITATVGSIVLECALTVHSSNAAYARSIITDKILDFAAELDEPFKTIYTNEDLVATFAIPLGAALAQMYTGEDPAPTVSFKEYAPTKVDSLLIPSLAGLLEESDVGYFFGQTQIAYYVDSANFAESFSIDIDLKPILTDYGIKNNTNPDLDSLIPVLEAINTYFEGAATATLTTYSNIIAFINGASAVFDEQKTAVDTVLAATTVDDVEDYFKDRAIHYFIELSKELDAPFATIFHSNNYMSDVYGTIRNELYDDYNELTGTKDPITFATANIEAKTILAIAENLEYLGLFFAEPMMVEAISSKMKNSSFSGDLSSAIAWYSTEMSATPDTEAIYAIVGDLVDDLNDYFDTTAPTTIAGVIALFNGASAKLATYEDDLQAALDFDPSYGKGEFALTINFIDGDSTTTHKLNFGIYNDPFTERFVCGIMEDVDSGALMSYLYTGFPPTVTGCDVLDVNNDTISISPMLLFYATPALYEGEVVLEIQDPYDFEGLTFYYLPIPNDTLTFTIVYSDDHYLITVELTDAAKEFIQYWEINYGAIYEEGQYAIEKIDNSGYYPNPAYLEIQARLSEAADAEGKKIVIYANDVEQTPIRSGTYGISPTTDTVVRFDIKQRDSFTLSFVDANDNALTLNTSSDDYVTYETDAFTIYIDNTSIETLDDDGIVFDDTRVSISFKSYYSGTIKLNGSDVSDEYGMYDIIIKANSVITIDAERQETKAFSMTYNDTHISQVNPSSKTEYAPGEEISISFYINTEVTGNSYTVGIKVNTVLVETLTPSSTYVSYYLDTTDSTDGIALEIVVNFSTDDYLVSFFGQDGTTPVSIDSLTGLTAQVDTTPITGNSVSVVYNESVSIVFTNTSLDKIFVVVHGATTVNILAGDTKTINLSRATDVKVYETIKYILTLADEDGNVTFDFRSFLFYNSTTWQNEGLSFSATGLDVYSNNSLLDSVEVTITATAMAFDLIVGETEISIAAGGTYKFTINANTVIKVKGYKKLNFVDVNSDPYDIGTNLNISSAARIQGGYSAKAGTEITIANYFYPNKDITIVYNGQEYTVASYNSVKITIIDDDYTIMIKD